MKCHYCGAPLEEGCSFCLCCGTRREAEASAPVAVAQELPVIQPACPAAEPPEEYPWDAGDFAPIPEPQMPALMLPIRRSLGKMVFLGILTLTIYPTVIWSRMVAELNIAASRYDGKRTLSFFGMILLAPLTLGIYPMVWMHRFCGRIGRELQRREIDYPFGARDFWLWNVLGCLILVGPFVFTHKLTKAMNKINGSFNLCG